MILMLEENPANLLWFFKILWVGDKFKLLKAEFAVGIAMSTTRACTAGSVKSAPLELGKAGIG